MQTDTENAPLPFPPQRREVSNPDPLVDSPASVPTGPDMGEHVRTYSRFVHLAWTFMLHMPLLLGGIYVMTLGGSPVGGVFLIAAAIIVLLFGIARAMTFEPRVV